MAAATLGPAGSRGVGAAGCGLAQTAGLGSVHLGGLAFSVRPSAGPSRGDAPTLDAPPFFLVKPLKLMRRRLPS